MECAVVRFWLVIAISIFLSGCGAAQKLPAKKHVPDEYKKEYAKEARETTKEWRGLRKEWDIVTDPIEAVPIAKYETRAAATTNWGEKLLAPNDTRQRIADECSCKVFIKIADTAGETEHPDLQTGRQPGRNYSSSSTLADIHGHGTHVSGIALADYFGLLSELTAKGIVKWQQLKALGDAGQGAFSWIANMLSAERTDDQRLTDEGWSVIYNGSFGGGTHAVPAVEQELRASDELGVLFVFAAGNSNGPVQYPGNSKFAITTASLDQNLERSSFSCYGPEVDEAMPGRNIASTWKGGNYATLSGTSMATPFLTAATAIAKSKWCGKLPDRETVKRYLGWVATDLGEPDFDDLYGWGIVYINAILDHDPADMPGGGPGPDPDPEPGKNITVTFQTDNHLLRWHRTPDDLRVPEGLIINKVILSATAKGSSHATLLGDTRQWVDKFFREHELILVHGMTGWHAVAYTGKFLEIIGKADGLGIKVRQVIGTDTDGNEYIILADDLHGLAKAGTCMCPAE